MSRTTTIIANIYTPIDNSFYTCKLISHQVAVNNVIHETSLIVDAVKNYLKQKVNECVNKNDEFTRQTINHVFEKFEDPFSNLQTMYAQSSFIRKNMSFVQPIEYVLGRNIGFKNKGSKRQMCEIEDTMVYIPILESIEQFLSNQRIFEFVTNPLTKSTEGIYYDIKDGTCLNGNPIFQLNTNALQIILYHDEIELCNPLGSHVGKHKVDLYYYTLGNVDPRFRSKLCAIRLVAIVKAQDVAKYGHGKILTPIVNDLEKLASGHIFNINGQPIKLHGAVVSCIADTEGQHQWAGFKVGVGFAHQKCRNCLCRFEEMQQKFKASEFTSRNLAQYVQHCEDIETAPTEIMKKDLQTTYGIIEKSLLSELSHFDITKQLPQDIMHILLEGSVQYEARLILQHFFNSGIITLQQLNIAFRELCLGYHDEKNRPPPLRETTFNDQDFYKMKLTAEQARVFLKNLPFILIKYISPENSHYQLLLQIVLIVQISFSPVTSNARVQELRDAIELHLKTFKELFPLKNIIPKMHYLIHIPDQILHLGPLIRHSCMRFEARHAYFKDIAPLQNFKNICLSLAERYQIDDCANLSNDNPNHHPIFQTEKQHGPVKKLEGNNLTALHEHMKELGLLLYPDKFTHIYTAKWIMLHGSTYKPDRGCVVAVDADFSSRMPLFGQLENIFLVGDEVVFEYIPLKTLEFSTDLMAYKVKKVCDSDIKNLCFYRRMLDYNIYSIVDVNNELYISLKYDLDVIIERHVIGENPLHY